MTVQIREVAQSTYLLDCGKDPVFQLSQVAYLLVGDKPVLIDPGPTSAASELLSNSSGLGLDLEDLAYIIPTHIHLDHGGGVGYLVQNLPKAKVVLHPRGVGHMIDPSRLIVGTRAAFGEDFEETLGPILPVPQDRVHVAEDGEVIRLGERDLRIFFSPGHAAHHIAIQDSLTGGLFCGDALGYISEDMPGMAMPVGLPPFDVAAYLETIDRLAGLSPSILFYVHHRARSEVDDLIRRVREMHIAFGDIAQKALEAGEDEQKISERVLEYLRKYAPEAELPVVVEASVSGYVEYFRNRK